VLQYVAVLLRVAVLLVCCSVSRFKLCLEESRKSARALAQPLKMSVAVCCSVILNCYLLQCVAASYSALQYVAVCCSVLQCVAVCYYSTSDSEESRESVLALAQHFKRCDLLCCSDILCYFLLQCVAVCCVAVCCSVL